MAVIRAMEKVVYCSPIDMLDAAEKEMEPIPHEQLFNNPRYQKLKERWCAGMFGVGYSKFVRTCDVAVNEGADRTDVDLYLRESNRAWEFQLAEVQVPERRRGLEYRQLAARKARTIPYEPERGRSEGPQWLAAAVERKKAKRYSNSAELHLLLYANFTARELEHSALLENLGRYSADFASLWIVTSTYLCSIFSVPSLGQMDGWGVVRDIEQYYT